MTLSKRPRVAFVVQRCGLDVNGGAEQHCLQVAMRMTKHWDVVVLTTCAKDYVTWSNHFPVGDEQIGDVTLRRFFVDRPRDTTSFDALSQTLAPKIKEATSEEQEAWMTAQGPISSGLLSHLTTVRDEYEAFIFFGYLYAQSYFGLKLVGNKGILAPLAHDEWPIYFSMWDEHFSLTRKFIFNTHEEREFLKRRFPTARLDGEIVGVGVERPDTLDVAEFRRTQGVEGRYFLYAGRVDPSKGCDTLFEYFLRWRAETGSDIDLVVIGGAAMTLPDHPAIRYLGYVDDATKWNALAGCQALIMPSKYESLSMVLLEAWAVMKPVVVNAECDVLVGQCRRSNGGLWYADFEEFTVELNTLMRSSLSTELGKSGYNYVKSEYSWPSIERKYLRLFSDTTNPLLPAVAQLTGDPSKHRMPSLNTVEKQ